VPHLEVSEAQKIQKHIDDKFAIISAFNTDFEGKLTHFREQLSLMKGDCQALKGEMIPLINDFNENC
jgi:hypothetical protein